MPRSQPSAEAGAGSDAAYMGIEKTSTSAAPRSSTCSPARRIRRLPTPQRTLRIPGATPRRLVSQCAHGACARDSRTRERAVRRSDVHGVCQQRELAQCTPAEPLRPAHAHVRTRPGATRGRAPRPPPRSRAAPRTHSRMAPRTPRTSWRAAPAHDVPRAPPARAPPHRWRHDLGPHQLECTRAQNLVPRERAWRANVQLPSRRVHASTQTAHANAAARTFKSARSTNATSMHPVMLLVVSTSTFGRARRPSSCASGGARVTHPRAAAQARYLC